ncbi:MAG: geranylgeranyl reductase family protein [Candidatus Thorarchaeota archaeon]
MVEYDVIIVGGGPAGSTAARRAALSGLSVLLLDKNEFPRNKPCAGGARFFVGELLDFSLNDVAHRKISGLSIFAPSGFRVDCIPEDRSKPGITVMREEFDHLLLKKAIEAGAEILENKEVIDIQESTSNVSVTTMDGDIYTGQFVIGADGVNSRVAKQLGFYSGWKTDSASVALEIELEVGAKKVREICGEPGGYDADLLLLYFGEYAHGYTWCFPKRSVLSVGACCRQDRVRDLRAGYERWFSKFKDEYDIEPEVLSDTSARFPVRPAERLVKGRSLLIGDAAGLVDAFTGEGIPEAIQSGIIAASVMKEAVKGSNPMALFEYEKECKKAILSELKVTQSLAKLFYKSMRNMETLCTFFRDDYYSSQLIGSAIGGLLSQKEVKRKLTLRMMRKNPKAALSLYS